MFHTKGSCLSLIVVLCAAAQVNAQHCIDTFPNCDGTCDNGDGCVKVFVGGEHTGCACSSWGEPIIVGACLLADNACVEVEAAECAKAGGEFDPQVTCPPPPPVCPTDLDGSGQTDVLDLVLYLLNWAGIEGLVAIILAWGPC
jgi:hypothetical protein